MMGERQAAHLRAKMNELGIRWKWEIMFDGRQRVFIDTGAHVLSLSPYSALAYVQDMIARRKNEREYYRRQALACSKRKAYVFFCEEV